MTSPRMRKVISERMVPSASLKFWVALRTDWVFTAKVKPQKKAAMNLHL